VQQVSTDGEESGSSSTAGPHPDDSDLQEDANDHILVPESPILSLLLQVDENEAFATLNTLEAQFIEVERIDTKQREEVLYNAPKAD
jgi:hypothetical protein